MFEFTLFMWAEAPANSLFAPHDRKSPLATLGEYVGWNWESGAPQWTRLFPGVAYTICQPHHLMAEIFRELAEWPEEKWVRILCFSLQSFTHLKSKQLHHDKMLTWANKMRGFQGRRVV